MGRSLTSLMTIDRLKQQPSRKQPLVPRPRHPPAKYLRANEAGAQTIQITTDLSSAFVSEGSDPEVKPVTKKPKPKAVPKSKALASMKSEESDDNRESHLPVDRANGPVYNLPDSKLVASEATKSKATSRPQSRALEEDLDSAPLKPKAKSIGKKKASVDSDGSDFDLTPKVPSPVRGRKASGSQNKMKKEESDFDDDV